MYENEKIFKDDLLNKLNKFLMPTKHDLTRLSKIIKVEKNNDNFCVNIFGKIKGRIVETELFTSVNSYLIEPREVAVKSIKEIASQMGANCLYVKENEVIKM